MATLDDLRSVALALPETVEGTSWGNAAWKVRKKTFVWERPLGKKDRADLGDAVPDGEIFALHAEDFGDKEALLASDPEVFFAIPHFDKYPLLLARLDAVDVDRLRDIVTDAWLVRAPEKLAREFLDDR